MNSITDPLNNTTGFTYDNLGRRTRITFPGNSYVDSAYDEAGRLLRVTDNLGVSTTNFYTVNGLVYTASNAFGRVFLHTFDIDDRLIASIDQNGVSLGYAYDDLGRLIVRTNRTYYDGGLDNLHVWADHYDYTNGVAAPVATYRAYTLAQAFSMVGWAAADTTRLSERIVNSFDLFGRKTNEVHVDTSDVAVLTNAFNYNAAGDLTRLIDGKAQTTAWRYDEFGRVTNKLDATSTEVFRYTYDANSQLATRWTPAKGTTAYSYDAVGNLTLVNYPASTDITLGYDANNRLTNMVDAVGTTRYGYTAFGALQSEDGPWDDDTVSHSYTANRLRSGLSLAQPNASAWSQSYAYDGANRLNGITSPAGTFGYEYVVGTDSTPAQLISRLTLPNGSAVTNQFDEQARWLGTYLRDSGGTLLNQHVYDYNDLDQRTKQTRKEGDFVDYGYDDLGQLTSAQAKESGGTDRWQERFLYNYDAAGNLNKRVQNVLTNVFNVDNLNQLTSVVRTNSSSTVAGTTTSAATNATVADNGNSPVAAIRYADRTFARTNVTLLNGTNTFVAVGQDTLGRSDTNTVTAYLPTAVTFLYDQNGNLRTNGSVVMTYDDENQLIAITNAGAWACTFVYDGKMRMRISKDYEWRNGAWVQTNEVRRVYDGMLVIQERDSFNVPKLSYTRGKDLSGSLEGAGGIGGLLALTDRSTINAQPSTSHSYFHADANGNVICLVDANQNVVARYLYDPFGNSLSATGPTAGLDKYRFSSKEWSASSSLIYYGYRWYSPELQRWINRDPIKEPGFEQACGSRSSASDTDKNIFAFVSNNPIDLIDSFGLRKNCNHPPECIEGQTKTTVGLIECWTGNIIIFCYNTPRGTICAPLPEWGTKVCKMDWACEAGEWTRKGSPYACSRCTYP